MDVTICFGGSLNVDLDRAQNRVGRLLSLNSAHDDMGCIPRCFLAASLLAGTEAFLQKVAGIEAGWCTLRRVHEVARSDRRVIVVHVRILSEYLVGLLLEAAELGAREELTVHLRPVLVGPRAAVGVTVSVVLVLEEFSVLILVDTEFQFLVDLVHKIALGPFVLYHG